MECAGTAQNHAQRLRAGSAGHGLGL